MMFHYYVFGGLNYYPDAGIDGLLKSFETLEEAVTYVESRTCKDFCGEWYQIVNENFHKVKEYELDKNGLREFT